MVLSFLPRILNRDVVRIGYILSNVPKFSRVQSAFITSKENRDPDIIKPAPWPYKTKKFTYLRGFFEGTLKRFDENTKIIVVDGNIGAGKSSFAKQLAEALDMEYFPEPTLEPFFVSPYGFDLRSIDELLPPSYKCCDINTFYKNPHHRNVPQFQVRMYMFRLNQYIDALAHVLNTGQGVVLERCVYGDFVFAETLHKFGYLGKPRVLELYNDINQNTLEELLRPHLIVYLDISPEVALERIKKRNNPIEVNSKALTKEYLETIEYFYKQKYLKRMEKHAELLIYDWSKYGDIEVVVEDIERLDFEQYTKYDTKMRDWQKDDWEWNYYRRRFTNDKGRILNYAYIFRPSVEELFHPGEELVIYRDLLDKVPGESYDEGWNPDAGDNVWFKLDPKSYWKTSFTRTYHY